MKTEQNGLKLKIEFDSSEALQEFLGNNPIEQFQKDMSGTLMAFEKDGWVCIDTSQLEYGTEDFRMMVLEMASKQLKNEVAKMQRSRDETQERVAHRWAKKIKWIHEVLCCLDPNNSEED